MRLEKLVVVVVAMAMCVRGWAQGRHHVFVSGASCFSFDAPDKHNRPMSTIHHNYVPGFWVHLQRGRSRLTVHISYRVDNKYLGLDSVDARVGASGMNRLFANIEPEQRWWRHNYSFESTDSVTHCVGHDKKWSRFVVPAERLPPGKSFCVLLFTGSLFPSHIHVSFSAEQKARRLAQDERSIQA